MSIVQHIKEHDQLGVKAFGREFITVGTTGDFATLEGALAYIATQPTMTQVSTTAVINCVQYDNFVPRVSGSFGDAQPGDFLYLTADDPGVDIYQYDWHHYRILSAIDNALEAMPGLYLESGILGATQNGIVAEILRPAKFFILLLPGDHSTTGATMPDGYDIIISGCGRATTVDGLGIYMPIYGFTEFTNFIQQGKLTRHDTRTMDVGNNLLDAGFSAVSMRDMWCEGEDCNVLGNSMFQSVRMKNVFCSGFKGHQFYAFVGADYLRIEDVEFDSVTSMEIFEMIRHGRRCDSSHKKIVKNWRSRRSQDHSTVPTAGHNAHVTVNVQPVLAGMPDYQIDFIHSSFEDDGLNVAAEQKAVFGFLSTPLSTVGVRMRFIDCEIINNNSHTYDLAVLPGYTVNNKLIIELIRTVGLSRRQITDAFAFGTAIVRRVGDGTYRDLAYAAGLVPDAAEAETHIVGTLTGNVLMLNPTNGVKGQRLAFVFTQDATGARTITWSGSSYKVHSNPVGAAGQKAVFTFLFDGSHYVQTNTVQWV